MEELTAKSLLPQNVWSCPIYADLVNEPGNVPLLDLYHLCAMRAGRPALPPAQIPHLHHAKTERHCSNKVIS